jgi:hypothetical protein
MGEGGEFRKMANETINKTKSMWYGVNPDIDTNCQIFSRYVEIVPREKLWTDNSNPPTTFAEKNRRDKENPPTMDYKVTKRRSDEEIK